MHHLSSSPSIEAIVGDLDEQYGQGRSRLWYWRQVAVAIVVSTFKDIRGHKLLTLRGLIVGWFVFWFLWSEFTQYNTPFFITLLDHLFANLHAIGVVEPARAPAGYLPPIYCYWALVMLSVWLLGLVCGGIVGGLHRRKISMVLAYATTILAFWIWKGLTIDPASVGVYPPLFWTMIAILTLGILLGGVLCTSHGLTEFRGNQT
jgi:hypothetical protein